MRYQVVWDQLALDQLTDFWISATDRKAVSDAAGAVDKLLVEHADAAGTPVHEGLYTLAVSPLRVIFWVHDMRRMVVVNSVKMMKP
jgi:mRNA-degrading endonuclease RelE of RelBE toxin-antitoxin system